MAAAGDAAVFIAGTELAAGAGPGSMGISRREPILTATMMTPRLHLRRRPSFRFRSRHFRSWRSAKEKPNVTVVGSGIGIAVGVPTVRLI